jgi:DNA modification methylase
MEVRTLKINKVQTNNGQIEGLPKNPRSIRDEKYKTLKKSIEDFPEMLSLREIVVYPHNDKFVCVGGNMRFRACKDLGHKEIIAKVLPADFPADKLAEFTIKDNSSFGDNDWDLLSSDWCEFEDKFQDWGLDVPTFEMVEDETEVKDAEISVDKAEELNKKWQVKSGELFSIGEHRLLCGDSTKRSHVDYLMDGQKAQLCLTDPPYGIAITRSSKSIGTATEHSRKATNESWDDTVPTKTAFDLMFEHSENQIVFGANYFWEYFHSSQCYIVWDKRGELPDVPFAPTEFAWTSFDKMSKKYTVINHGFISDEKQDKRHPTSKPVKLFTPILEDFSNESDLVYEPFAGSGTTLVACQNLGRKCYAIEISPNYCAVILERLSTAFPDIEIKRIEQTESASV